MHKESEAASGPEVKVHVAESPWLVSPSSTSSGVAVRNATRSFVAPPLFTRPQFQQSQAEINRTA